MKQLSPEQLKGLVARVTNMSTQDIEVTRTAYVASLGATIVLWRPNGLQGWFLKHISLEDMYIGAPEGSTRG